MNDESKQFEGAERTLVWPGDSGRRATFRLDHPTWAAIDRIAALRGQRWTEWTRELLARHPDAVNMRAVIRAAVVEELLQNSIFTMLDERVEQLEASPPALLGCASTLDLDQLTEDLSASTLDGDPVNLYTHTILTGTDPYGRACVWVRSNVAGGMHYAIPLQTTLAEQRARLASPDWRETGGAA